MFTQIQVVRTGFRHRFVGATEAQGTEGLRKGELLRMTGPAIPLGKISGNGRRYIPESVHAQVADLQPRIAQKALFGVLDHPAVDDINQLAYVKMTDVSHRIDALWYNEADKTYYITVTILDTPNGRILKTIHDSGSPLYVSLRSLLDPSRNVQRSGYVDAWMLALITVDFVSRPGFADAELKAVDVAGNECALAVCESLNLFAKHSKRIFDMKSNKNKSRYIPVISMESIAGVATEPTADFKSAVTAFIADVLDKLPGKFTATDFAEAYPDSMFDGNIVGLYEDSQELMIKDDASSTVAIIKLCSETDGEYELCDDNDAEYFDTDVANNSSGADAGNESMYAVIATEGYEPSEGFIDTANAVAAYMKENYGEGFTQDDFNTSIADELSDNFDVSARISSDDDKTVLKIQDDDNAASIVLSVNDDMFVPGDVTEYWEPGTEAFEVGSVATLKDAKGDDIVSGEIEQYGTFGELKDTIESEDEVGFSNMTSADIDDDTQVLKIAGNWYYVNDEVSVECGATEGIDAVQQTEGNVADPIDIDNDYMNNQDNTDAGDDTMVEVLDDEDDVAKANKSTLTEQMYDIVEEDKAEIIDDEPDGKANDDEPDDKDDEPDDTQADAELAEEAQRVFAMPNSKFAGNYAIEHMPTAFKHIWSGLSDAAKATVAAQAKDACIANESQNLKFWHSTNFVAIERACIISKGKVQAALESMTQPEDPRIAFMKGCIKA